MKECNQSLSLTVPYDSTQMYVHIIYKLIYGVISFMYTIPCDSTQIHVHIYHLQVDLWCFIFIQSTFCAAFSILAQKSSINQSLNSTNTETTDYMYRIVYCTVQYSRVDKGHHTNHDPHTIVCRLIT